LNSSSKSKDFSITLLRKQSNSTANLRELSAVVFPFFVTTYRIIICGHHSGLEQRLLEILSPQLGKARAFLSGLGGVG
jgi:hypothetical protein